MPVVKPLPPNVIRDLTPFGQVWCDFFRRAFMLLAQMRGYKTYDIVLEDYSLPLIRCQFDGKYTVQVTSGKTNDILLELLDHDGAVLSTFPIKLVLLYGRNPITVSRLFSQRLTGYLP